MSGLAWREVTPPGDAAPGRGDPPPAPLYVLHGFLGSGRNWSSFARRLVDLRPDWRAVLVDLRLHGESREDLPGPHTVAAAAADVADLHRELTGAVGGAAVLGHSFGGKVALALTAAMDPPPVQTWIVDGTPAAGEATGVSGRMLSRLEDSPEEFRDRDEAVAFIREAGFDLPTARWMATNLERREDAWGWRLDAAGLRELLEDFRATDSWHVLSDPPEGSDIHLVRASTESILSDDAAGRIRELAAAGAPLALHELVGGHWLHVDNPDGLLDLVAARLPRLPRRRSAGS